MPNRLIHEKSPYLLQHATNPVDWYPWGEEAFQAARTLERPIFLSIGYATCHWCHVMEHESFSDVEIAGLMNDAFVNVKVDREELPHIDTLYMEFAQALMSSAGGWPLNLVLTPDLKPFLALTYLPPRARKGMMGFDQLILQVKELWQGGERDQLVEQATHLVQAFASSVRARGEELPEAALLERAVQRLFELGDPLYGGIKGEPKFPLSYLLELLLQFSKLKGESRALFFAEATLNAMRRGGVYDHLAGGFHRYSIDGRWLVPHFEKTLYDNALLAAAFLEGWKYTHKEVYRRTVVEILDFFLSEMRSAEGGFFSAQDADTDGKEGLYYTWTMEEIFSVLEEDEAELIALFYGMNELGNFEGRTVLSMPLEIDEFATKYSLPLSDVEKLLAQAKQKLLKRRRERAAPLKDDKLITGWNGLMIHALARAASALKRDDYLAAAEKTARFLREKLWREGRLLRRFRDGEARFSATVEDYAFLIKGLLTLFEESGSQEWLAWALELAEILEREFKAAGGAFYQTSEKETVLVRLCDFYDGAEPSGNGVHAENLVRIYQLTGEEGYLAAAEDILKAARGNMEHYPPGCAYHLLALQRYLDTRAPTLIIALNEKGAMQSLLAALSDHFSLHLTKAWRLPQDPQFEKLLSAHADKKPLQNKTTLYLCRGQVCEPPLIEAPAIEKLIQSL